VGEKEALDFFVSSGCPELVNVVDALGKVGWRGNQNAALDSRTSGLELCIVQFLGGPNSHGRTAQATLHRV
jgi:hypothetical protein